MTLENLVHTEVNAVWKIFQHDGAPYLNFHSEHGDVVLNLKGAVVYATKAGKERPRFTLLTINLREWKHTLYIPTPSLEAFVKDFKDYDILVKEELYCQQCKGDVKWDVVITNEPNPYPYYKCRECGFRILEKSFSTEDYDFLSNQQAHVDTVDDLLRNAMWEIQARRDTHDDSKLSGEEFLFYSACLPLLQKHKYGTPKHTAAVKKLGPALEHHYKRNRHHPEHFAKGVDDMNLVDLLEMLSDHIAAAQRDGRNPADSLEFSAKRFHLSPQLVSILKNSIPLLEGK